MFLTLHGRLHTRQLWNTIIFYVDLFSCVFFILGSISGLYCLVLDIFLGTFTGYILEPPYYYNSGELNCDALAQIITFNGSAGQGKY